MKKKRHNVTMTILRASREQFTSLAINAQIQEDTMKYFRDYNYFREERQKFSEIFHDIDVRQVDCNGFDPVFGQYSFWTSAKAHYRLFLDKKQFMIQYIQRLH